MPHPSDDRVDASSWEVVRVETRGAGAKYWIREPGGSSTRFESDWLFKPVTQQANGIRQIGDWTESAGSALARALDIPAAEARMAIRGDVEGVISRNVRAAGYDMMSGRLAMLHETGVETKDSARDKTASIGHSVNNVFQTLRSYEAPAGWDAWEDCSAVDVMVAYLVLDALIGNGDRHEHNWSVLRASSSSSQLRDAIAPSYDLEASLGFQLSDDKRLARLNDPRSMMDFARKGFARRFEGDRTTSLVDLAVRSISLCTSIGQRRIQYLVERIERLDFAAILAGVGPVSEVARTFAFNVLEINGRRLVDADWNIT